MQKIILVKSLNEEMVERAKEALITSGLNCEFNLEKSLVIVNGGVDETIGVQRVLAQLGWELL